jgi:hypothetical protein
VRLHAFPDVIVIDMHRLLFVAYVCGLRHLVLSGSVIRFQG